MATTVSEQPVNTLDLAGGIDYLSQLSLAEPLLAERQLMRFLDGLMASPPEPATLLALLEQARTPLSVIEDELARGYHNKPLPLTEAEERGFRQVTAGWRKMGQAYALCARLHERNAENAGKSASTATLLHRCLYYAGMIILEHYRVRREVPPGAWRDMHRFYASAEASGVACTPVEDFLDSPLQATHCAAAYVALLLIDMAGPYQRSTRDLALIRRWAHTWAPLVSLHCLADDVDLPPYIVELAKDSPLHPSAGTDEPADDTRRIDTSRLGLQINHMLSQLHQRVTPSQLGLGEETSSHVTDLLQQLSQPWTQSAAPRRFRRFVTHGVAKVATGFDAMHFHVTGGDFRPADTGPLYSRGEFDQLFTFRERAAPDQPLAIKPPTDFPLDGWDVINHSASGFRLARTGTGQRIAHGQLLAVCPPDSERFLLGRVSWLMQDDSGGLIAGVANLPGMPVGIGIRHAMPGMSSNEPFVRAFLLPAVPAIHETASIVLPPGHYRASGVVEATTHDGNPWRLRMNHLLQRGNGFDRISYEAI